MDFVPHVDDCYACATGLIDLHDPRCSRYVPSDPADGPGVYEVVVEARVTVTAATRRFAHLRAQTLVGSAFCAGEAAGGRVLATGSRKIDGPEFEPVCFCPRTELGTVGANPGDCRVHPLPGCPNSACGETWVESFHGDRCSSCGWERP